MESKNDIKNSSNGNVTLSIDTLTITDISLNNNTNNRSNNNNNNNNTNNINNINSINNNNSRSHSILSTSTPSTHNLVGSSPTSLINPLHNSTGSSLSFFNGTQHLTHNHHGNMNGFGNNDIVTRTKQEDNYSMAKVYLNNKLSFNNHGLGRVDFNMKSEDLDQPWFHKEATRDVAITLLHNRPTGSFLIRPSSQAGSYAMSWMKSGNEIGHNLIYGLCPGYSLKQNSTTDRFWSLQKLVEDCDYLKLPIQVSQTTKNIAKHSNARTNAEVVGRIVERVSSNDPTFTELSWSLCIIGENTNESSDHCQKRTRVKFGDEEYTAPEILPLNGNSLSLICQGLHNNTHTKSLYINGHEGYLRMSFIPNLLDSDAAAIASLITENKSLTLLNLSVNQISDNGTKLIAEALKYNKTLKYISLSYNFIGKDGLVAISEAIRYNKSIDFIDVSNQLFKKRNSINLIHLDTERTLMALIEDTMKRKCELFGMSYKFLDMPQTLSPNNGSVGINCGATQSKLPYFHGYLTKMGAEKRINALSKGKIGSFIFYLNYYIPNCIFLAILVQKGNNPAEIEHKMIHRVHFGYRFVSGGLSSTEQDLRDEILEEEQLYNFQLNNQTYNNTITHSNSYIYSYRHRPRRTGCGVVIPTLFEFCAWILASHPQYQDILNAFESMGGISERFKDIRDLVPLWGARDVVPIISLDSFKHNISRKGVFPTLLQLYKLNRSKLTNPITTEQYQNYRTLLKQQQQLQQHQQELTNSINDLNNITNNNNSDNNNNDNNNNDNNNTSNSNNNDNNNNNILNNNDNTQNYQVFSGGQ